MVNPSSESTQHAGGSPQAASMGVVSIDQRVGQLAEQCESRSDFLKQIAVELRESFRVALVAVESSGWASPMMLVTDDLLSRDIDRASVRGLLESSGKLPIACDVPLRAPSLDGQELATGGQHSVRGIRVELSASPDRAAVLLIYDRQRSPSASDQVRDLKSLGQFSQSIRDALVRLPADVERWEEPESTLPAVATVPTAVVGRQTLKLFHRDLDLRATTYRIANETRRLLGSDRVTVLVPKHKRYRVSAMSGVSVVDSRSNAVRSVESLAQCAAVMSRPLIFPSSEPLPPQIQEPLDHYLDESGVTSAVLLPIHSPDEDDEREGIEAAEIDPFHGSGDILGVMVLEYFSGAAPAKIDQPITMVASEASLALRNATEHRNVFGLSLWKSVGSLVHSSRFPWLVSALVLATAMLVAAATVQIEHHVIATGNVEPMLRRQVFATVDGIVKTVHVKDGQLVNAGDRLFELENAELESQAESLAGEIQTTSRRITSLQSMRLSPESDAKQSSRLALEERQLQSELANLRAQQKIIEVQQAELIITSPIDGTVVGWQLKRRLSDRPVSRGNLLVSVVDQAGPWSLRLHVPDRDAGPVLEAADRDGSLPIRFAVATQPEASFAAKLHSIGRSARLSETGQHIIDASASVTVPESQDSASEEFDPFRGQDVRVGADVTAKIACGKRSVLRSWFSDVFDFAHRNILFYFR